MRVRAAVPSDARPIGELVARAFDEDPVMTWVFFDARTRHRVYPRMMAALFRHSYLPRGGCQVAERDGVPAGAALWVPPGRLGALRWRQALTAPALLLAAGPSGFVRLTRQGVQLDEVLKSVHPGEPHWYLSVLGTDPAAQGSGVGGALLRSRLCDRDGLPAYLECIEANVVLYQHFGFAMTSTVQVPDGGPVLHGMWREPATS